MVILPPKRSLILSALLLTATAFHHDVRVVWRKTTTTPPPRRRTCSNSVRSPPHNFYAVGAYHSLAVLATGHKTNDTTTLAAERHRRRRRDKKKRDYEVRRALWEERYGSVEALRNSFGGGWGDLGPEATRQLYHTLLPRSLLGLHEAGLLAPEELAPLAYQARVAAKAYARERCIWPARLIAVAFDAYRSFRRDGTFHTKGVGWEQLWEKYEAQIVEEECVQELEGKKIDKEALTNRIYQKILERSCATNQAFDQMFLHNKTIHNNDQDGSGDLGDLDAIAARLESDVREILLHPRDAKRAVKFAEKADKEREKVERKKEKAALREVRKTEKAERKRAEAEEKENAKRRKKLVESTEETKDEIMLAAPHESRRHLPKNETSESDHDRRRRAYSVLRIVARTRRKFRTQLAKP